MRCLALIASLFSFVCAFAQTPADTSTPESALQAFFKAWNTKDTASAANLIVGVHIDAEQMKGVKEMMDPHMQLSGSEFQTIMQGDDAVVIYQLQIAQNGQSQTGEDMVQLKHTADGWRIVPPKSKGFNNIGRMGISVIAQVIADPDFLKKARESAERATCSSHIRQCGLGMIMYAADYDDVMKVPPSQSELLYDALQAAGGDATLLLVPGATHDTAGWTTLGNVTGALDAFFDRTLKPARQRGVSR